MALTTSPETAVVMTAHDGQKYFCSLPSAIADDSASSASSSSTHADTGDGDGGGGGGGAGEGQESEKTTKKTGAAAGKEDAAAKAAKAAKRSSDREGKVVSELLEPLASACFYRIEGWWTYEFCHKQKVRQYHQEGESITGEFSLGEYDARATKELHVQQGHFPEAPGATGSNERFHAHVFTGGTSCDLTDLERQTEVRFVCAPAGGVNAITAIKEPATCKYTFTFATPLLCNHRSFKVQEKPVSQIKCRAFAEDVDGSGGSGGGRGGGSEGAEGGGLGSAEHGTDGSGASGGGDGEL